MKRIIAITVAVLAVSALAFAHAQTPLRDKQQIQQVQHITELLLRCVESGDGAFVKHVADNAIFATGNGNVFFTKAAAQSNFYRRNFRGVQIKTIKAQNTQVMMVEVKGDIAIAAARAWQSDGKGLSTEQLFNLTFAKRDGNWQIISGSFNTGEI